MESRELAEVVADNLLALKGREDPSPLERERLCQEAAAHFWNASTRVQREYPEAARKLEQVQLTAEQRSAVLDSMRNLRDPRLRQLGQEVATVLRASLAGTAEEKGAAKRHLAEYLRSRAAEVRLLHNEVTPALLRDTDSTGDDDIDLDVDHLIARLGDLRLLQTISNWDVELEVTAGGERRLLSLGDFFGGGKSKDDTGMFGKVADSAGASFDVYAEADQFWDKIRKIAWKDFDVDLPPFSKIVQTVDMESLMKCVMSTAVHPLPSNIKSCAMEFATTAENVMRVMFGKEMIDAGPRMDQKLAPRR